MSLGSRFGKWLGDAIFELLMYGVLAIFALSLGGTISAIASLSDGGRLNLFEIVSLPVFGLFFALFIFGLAKMKAPWEDRDDP